MTRKRVKQKSPDVREKLTDVESKYHTPTNQFVAAKSDVAAPDDTPFRGDPYLPAARVQYIKKRDFTVMSFVADKCTTTKQYASNDSKTVYRLCWVPPMVIKPPDDSGKKQPLEGDQRGVFADIALSKVTFRNVMKQPVKIVINSPRGRISDPSDCYLRRNKRELVIQPGRTRTFTATWGDKANIFTPLALTLETQEQKPHKSMQGFAIVDFVVIIPEVDEMSGKLMSQLTDQSVVEVRVMQNYIATASYTGYGSDMVYVSRKPFTIVKLEGLKDMMYESGISLQGVLPFKSLTLRSAAGSTLLYSDGELWRNEELEGRLLVLMGVAGFFKVVRGNLVHWDAVLDQPHDIMLEPPQIAPGTPYQVLPVSLNVSFKDIIAFLTTVTEILTVVAAFL